MDWSRIEDGLSQTSIWIIGIAVFAALCVAAALGTAIRSKRDQEGQTGKFDSQEGYVVSAVLGLLALLIGFTFSLAVDRFDTRRRLVLEEANAIGTTYLRTQLLIEPYRQRMSDLLIRYTDNRIALARAKPGEGASLLATNDALITDVWVTTIAAFDSIKEFDFSSTYLESVNNVIDLDASRKAARRARIPSEVHLVLFVNLIMGAAVLGYVLRGHRGRLSAGFLILLFALALMLIIDIDRPTLGGILEDQGPMVELRKSMAGWQPGTFDRLRAASNETYTTSRSVENPKRERRARESERKN